MHIKLSPKNGEPRRSSRAMKENKDNKRNKSKNKNKEKERKDCGLQVTSPGDLRIAFTDQKAQALQGTDTTYALFHRCRRREELAPGLS